MGAAAVELYRLALRRHLAHVHGVRRRAWCISERTGSGAAVASNKLPDQDELLYNNLSIRGKREGFTEICFCSCTQYPARVDDGDVHTRDLLWAAAVGGSVRSLSFDMIDNCHVR